MRNDKLVMTGATQWLTRAEGQGSVGCSRIQITLRGDRNDFCLSCGHLVDTFARLSRNTQNGYSGTLVF